MPKFGTFKFGQEKFGSKPARYTHLPTKDQQILGIKARKQLAKEIIYRVRYGRQEQYAYFIPANPRTESQQANRSKFTTAVADWKALPEDEKKTWEEIAKETTIPGRNLFIREEMLK